MSLLRRSSRRSDQSRSEARAPWESRASDSPDSAVPLTPIEDSPGRRLVRLEGTLRTVTLRPRGGVPALEAELADGTGTITVVWLGRRRILGVQAGCAVRVLGRIGVHDGVRTMYNPRYELLP